MRTQKKLFPWLVVPVLAVLLGSSGARAASPNPTDPDSPERSSAWTVTLDLRYRAGALVETSLHPGLDSLPSLGETGELVAFLTPDHRFVNVPVKVSYDEDGVRVQVPLPGDLRFRAAYLVDARGSKTTLVEIDLAAVFHSLSGTAPVDAGRDPLMMPAECFKVVPGGSATPGECAYVCYRGYWEGWSAVITGPC